MPSNDKPLSTESPALGVSRREFARRAVIGAASASFLPLNGIVPGAASRLAPDEPQQSAQAPAGAPKLAAQSQAEAEARWKSIIDQYDDRFNEAQKADLKRLCFFVQPALDKVRAYAVGNGSLPGLYLKPLVDRDKKPMAASAAASAATRRP